MFQKSLLVRDSQTKSCFHFQLRGQTRGGLGKHLFSDPAALPMLRRIADSLRAKGFKVTAPQRGKACDGGFQVNFASGQISVIMIVERSDDVLDFSLLTWPCQSLGQKLKAGGTRPYIDEWRETCDLVHDFLVRELKPESLQRMTFMESEQRATRKDDSSC